MKKILVLVTFGCLAFIVLAFAFQYVPAPGSFTDGTFSGSSGTFSTDYSDKTNPLLDFGDSYTSGSGGYGSGSGSNYNTDGIGTSPYSGTVALSSGNASYAYQTYEEYLTIHNYGNPVSITGWTLTNSKGTRPIENRQNNYVYPANESATIGVGTNFLNPSGVFQTGPIILNKGDTAYITTGKPFSQYPFSINTSFRENICMGYLENYPFNPPINKSCPVLSADPGVRNITDECYDYVRSIYSCTDPSDKDKKRFDLLTTQCRAFIESKIGYANCVANHSSSSKFALNQWRVFLGKDREMWASSRETITLYDSQGLIVDQISY